MALGSWLLALGSWLLALGSWLLALGSWLLIKNQSSITFNTNLPNLSPEKSRLYVSGKFSIPS
ncbi:hypothetical protein ES765_20400 [Maribacter sp. ACAM166]|nr:hypothetical protein ES765_20400 [Maribacter sp. ACAM166]